MHLPQWVAYLLGSPLCSETTSLGCHTMLWDFKKNDYHQWAKLEGIEGLFPAIFQASVHPYLFSPHGLHDSSAALIPYLACFEEPFVLISTGTWCISLNPFNEESLTAGELAQDCLCYLTPSGKPVKAARYFGGYEHDAAVKNFAETYGVSPDFYLHKNNKENHAAWDAYERFMYEKLAPQQAASTRLAIGNTPVRKLFVDGGFSKNECYMSALARFFPDFEIYSAEVAQATALGAALAVHASFNSRPILPTNLVGVSRVRE